jgi:hypothetical protein
METNNFFTLKRLMLLLRRQVFSSGKSLLIAFAGVSGFLLILSLLVAYFNPAALSGLTSTYFTVMFIGGYIFTSNIFNEMHTPQKAYSYLTLPVSTTERLASAWILTGWLFPLVSLLLMSLIVLLANLIMNMTVDLAPFQGVFSAAGMKAVKVYIVTQSLFLLGAAYFRKNNFLKTLLALFLVSLAINIYMGLTGWLLFRDLMGEGGFNVEAQTLSPFWEHLFTKQFPAIFHFVFYYLTIPFFLVTTWFGIKERQV